MIIERINTTNKMTMEINIKNLNKPQYTSLIRTLYTATRIDHFVYENKKYRECSNQWSDEDDTPREPYDPDQECTAYMNDGEEGEESEDDDICYFKPSVFPVYDGSVIYKINFHIDTLKDYLNDIESPTIKNVFKNIIEFIQSGNKLTDINFTGYNSIVLKNICGINPDHRGSTHCNLAVNYEETYQLTKLNLNQLIVGMYRIKSHKFDYNYEMFISCSKKIEPNNRLVIEFDFDHGS
jgi:hypothetical protein